MTKNELTFDMADSSAKKGDINRPRRHTKKINPYDTTIKVFGVGGAGSNTVNHFKKTYKNSILSVAANTDAQHLLSVRADKKILLGKNVTGGLGAGGDPMIGESAAEESKKILSTALDGTDMLFLTCGLGGGTGTGATPIIGGIAKQKGILTVGIVTMPFSEEGIIRWENAQIGLDRLRKNVDSLIILENDKLGDLFPDSPLTESFQKGDEILINALTGISELVTTKGFINLDFADVSMVLRDGPMCYIGLGESRSEMRGEEAVKHALSHPMMINDPSGAESALIHISGGTSLTLQESKNIVRYVVERLDPGARIIWGNLIEKSYRDKVKVLVLLGGLKTEQAIQYKASDIIGAEIPKGEESDVESEPLVPVENGRTIFDIKESIISSGSEITTKKRPAKPLTQTTMLFYRIFEEEASGDINKFERSVRLLKENSENRRAILDAKQSCRLLLASAQMFGFNEIGQLLQAIDTMLGFIQSRELQLTSDILESLGLAIEMVKDLMTNRTDGRGESGYIVNRIRELQEEQWNAPPA